MRWGEIDRREARSTNKDIPSTITSALWNQINIFHVSVISNIIKILENFKNFLEITSIRLYIKKTTFL